MKTFSASIAIFVFTAGVVLLCRIGWRPSTIASYSKEGNQQQHPQTIQRNSKNDDDLILVSCVGDSITSFGCASRANMTYVAQLQTMLGSKYQVTNFGASGHTMLKDGYCANNAKDCNGNCAYWTSPMFPKVMNSTPDIVTIMLGTNDAKGCNWYGPPNGMPKGWGVEFRSAYLDMVSQFKSLPSQPKVYLIIPPPLVNPPNHPDQPPPFNMKKEVLNHIMPHLTNQIADETGADGVIDVWTALGGEAGYASTSMTCDGCHPKDPAMTIIAATIAKALTESASSSTSDNGEPTTSKERAWILTDDDEAFVLLKTVVSDA